MILDFCSHFVPHALRISAQITFVRTPAKVMDSSDHGPAMFEFEIGDMNTTDVSDADSRLSYRLSGPGAGSNWKAVPVVSVEEWELTVKNITGETVSSSGGSKELVWALMLSHLGDGEYRLQVRQHA